MEFIKKYENKDWDWDEISSHKNLKMDFIQNNQISHGIGI